MEFNNGEFKTNIDEGLFDIIITQESDCSVDSGYSFETVSNIYSLDRDEARTLAFELDHFLNNTK